MLAERRFVMRATRGDGAAAAPTAFGRREGVAAPTTGAAASSSPTQSLQVRLSSRLPAPGTGRRAGEHGAQTGSRHRRHRCGRRSCVNLASHTAHHRSSVIDSSDDSEEEELVRVRVPRGRVPTADMDAVDQEERRLPPPPPPLMLVPPPLTLLPGDPTTGVAAGRPREDLRLLDLRGCGVCCCCCCLVCHFRPEISGVDTIERREEVDATEEVSESSPAREEASDERET